MTYIILYTEDRSILLRYIHKNVYETMARTYCYLKEPALHIPSAHQKGLPVHASARTHLRVYTRACVQVSLLHKGSGPTSLSCRLVLKGANTELSAEKVLNDPCSFQPTVTLKGGKENKHFLHRMTTRISPFCRLNSSQSPYFW